MTICNTGALATAGWGTALGVLRTLHARGTLGHAMAGPKHVAETLGKTGENSRGIGEFGDLPAHLHILELSMYLFALCFGALKQQLLESRQQDLHMFSRAKKLVWGPSFESLGFHGLLSAHTEKVARQARARILPGDQALQSGWEVI